MHEYKYNIYCACINSLYSGSNKPGEVRYGCVWPKCDMKAVKGAVKPSQVQPGTRAWP